MSSFGCATKRPPAKGFPIFPPDTFDTPLSLGLNGPVKEFSTLFEYIRFDGQLSLKDNIWPDSHYAFTPFGLPTQKVIDCFISSTYEYDGHFPVKETIWAIKENCLFSTKYYFYNSACQLYRIEDENPSGFISVNELTLKEKPMLQGPAGWMVEPTDTDNFIYTHMTPEGFILESFESTTPPNEAQDYTAMPYLWKNINNYNEHGWVIKTFHYVKGKLESWQENKYNSRGDVVSHLSYCDGIVGEIYKQKKFDHYIYDDYNNWISRHVTSDEKLKGVWKKDFERREIRRIDYYSPEVPDLTKTVAAINTY